MDRGSKGSWFESRLGWKVNFWNWKQIFFSIWAPEKRLRALRAISSDLAPYALRSRNVKVLRNNVPFTRFRNVTGTNMC